MKFQLATAITGVFATSMAMRLFLHNTNKTSHPTLRSPVCNLDSALELSQLADNPSITLVPYCVTVLEEVRLSMRDMNTQAATSASMKTRLDVISFVNNFSQTRCMWQKTRQQSRSG
ncbi:hypothetical protein MKZ38_005498 [Zalerion maritima]|uniref:Uncharacterized protein n=1 Tax=Zalerion maritima TaxID=339359 RepID=A0AAD5RXL5_9PEZI|nr:hypothetical protein MKZ38_005498 [Zalerion maritima]